MRVRKLRHAMPPLPILRTLLSLMRLQAVKEISCVELPKEEYIGVCDLDWPCFAHRHRLRERLRGVLVRFLGCRGSSRKEENCIRTSATFETQMFPTIQ